MRFTDGNDTGGSYSAGNIRLRKGIGTHYSEIMTSVDSETANSGTPLASALNESRLYLNYHKSNDNAKDCRLKFVILISDGADTYACSGNGQESQTNQYKRRRETVAKAKQLADAGYKVFLVGFGADMPHWLRYTLNWAAYYGGTQSTSNPSSPGNPVSFNPASYLSNPVTYTTCGTDSSTNHHSIEGDGDHYYATSGDPGELPLTGYAFLATNATELADSLKAIAKYIAALKKESTAYVAPVVPISQYTGYESENRLYLGMFKPGERSLWKGNIKKFGIATENSGGIQIGDVLDSNGELAMNELNEIRCDKDYPAPGTECRTSYWSSLADGGEVEKGGIGEVLLNRTSARNIYTYLGNPDLTHSSNAFTLANTGVTPLSLGLDPGDTTGRENIINFIHGLDAYDWNGDCGLPGPPDPTKSKDPFEDIPDGITNVKRCWILGSFVHSRPLVIHYGTTSGSPSVIFAGANDGMFHAFDNVTGEELWAFIPPNLLPKLKNLNGTLIEFFVDGSPKTYLERDGSGNLTKAIIIFGQRRGGNRYIALDVTDRYSPRFLYEIGPSTPGFAQLGQTWSSPRIAKIKNGSGTKWVTFFAGGYDMNQDNVPVTASDTVGRAIYAIDILTGAQIWKYSNSENPSMTYSIPSDITTLDTNGDSKVDRLYVGDMGGRMWRFDIGDAGDTSSWSGRIIFSGHTGAKIFYPPDVTFEREDVDFEMLFFGTGDRENPKDVTVVNRLYALKDRLPYPHTPMTEADLKDVTEDLLQASGITEPEKNAILSDLRQKNGWFIKLDQTPGEKCVSTPVTFYGGVYYSTFSPTLEGQVSICNLGPGTATLYIVDYKTAKAIFNLDTTNDESEEIVLRRSDRAKTIGAGIPSGVIITFISGQATGYVGVGGGVYLPDLSKTKPLIPLNWRVLF
jgi:type IV pilus assembly protein PilY1